jgi:hypothetical protein
MVDKLQELINGDQQSRRHDIVTSYTSCATILESIKESPRSSNFYLYYYHKGQSDILKQLMLNTPLLVKQQTQ